MIKVALIGAGKMGQSHLAILGAHSDVKVVGVTDPSKLVTDVLSKYGSFNCYIDYKKMFEAEKPEAVFVAAPTKYHTEIVSELLKGNIHVFVEKPFSLNTQEGKTLVQLAKEKKLINQVAYHNKFLGTFEEAKQLISEGFLREIQHFTGEAYGPVVVKPKLDTWRSKPTEGGGCLMDYASHVIVLINFLIAPVENVHGSILKSFYSDTVEGAVYALLETRSKISGVLSVNWSDETYRKMSTSLTIIGTNGKIIVDATELKVFFKANQCPTNYTKGWNIRHINELTQTVDFSLRGEDDSLQVDYFIKAVQGKVPNIINTFESALLTHMAIEQIKYFTNN
jgi:predicted dehydrogenase